jgi:hypothetical protein
MVGLYLLFGAKLGSILFFAGVHKLILRFSAQQLFPSKKVILPRVLS